MPIRRIFKRGSKLTKIGRKKRIIERAKKFSKKKTDKLFTYDLLKRGVPPWNKKSLEVLEKKFTRSTRRRLLGKRGKLSPESFMKEIAAYKASPDSIRMQKKVSKQVANFIARSERYTKRLARKRSSNLVGRFKKAVTHGSIGREVRAFKRAHKVGSKKAEKIITKDLLKMGIPPWDEHSFRVYRKRFAPRAKRSFKPLLKKDIAEYQASAAGIKMQKRVNKQVANFIDRSRRYTKRLANKAKRKPRS